MDLPYSIQELRAATHELVSANGLPSCYIRPIAFFGYGRTRGSRDPEPVDVVIGFPGAYLGEDGQKKGITTMVSSWERVGPNVIPHVAKATGIYLNSMLATTEARAGYDEAIMLTRDGYVADGPGENIFVVKNGRLLTPPLSMSILPGSRDTIVTIAGALGYPVEETLLIRTDLYLAGRSVHGRDGDGGCARAGCRRTRDRRRPDHLELQKAYLDTVEGKDQRWSDWLDVVETSRSSRGI